MAINTEHYGLKKPAAEDFYSVADQNGNMDKIDAALKGLEDGKAGLDGEGKVPVEQLPEMDYVPTEDKGRAGGVAELGADGKVPSSQLPSYVDDVLEYAGLSTFPAAGEAGKIYVAKDTNKTYRWSGSGYVEISQGVALGETSATAYRGDRGKIAYEHSQAKGNPHGATAEDVGARPSTWVPAWGEVAEKPSAFPPAGHTHDDRYFTETETLSAATAALLGPCSTPDGALAFLGKYNQHWWRRRINTAVSMFVEKQTLLLNKYFLVSGESTYISTVPVSVADKITIDSSGNIVLAEPKSINISYNTAESTIYLLLGKYIKSGYIGSSIIYVPQNALLQKNADYGDNNDYFYVFFEKSTVNTVSAEFSIEGTISPWQYLHSSDRNAYPGSGIVDGYEYEYLGVPLDNAVTAPQIATGSYTGTGTYNTANPNSLTFDFVPKIIIIKRDDEAIFGTIALYGEKVSAALFNYSYTLHWTWIENTVRWANFQNADYQLNSAGKLFYYLAIG